MFWVTVTHTDIMF